MKSFRCCFEQAREAIYRMKKYLRMFNFENGRQPITNSEGAKATYMCATKFTTGTNFSLFLQLTKKFHCLHCIRIGGSTSKFTRLCMKCSVVYSTIFRVDLNPLTFKSTCSKTKINWLIFTCSCCFAFFFFVVSSCLKWTSDLFRHVSLILLHFEMTTQD